MSQEKTISSLAVHLRSFLLTAGIGLAVLYGLRMFPAHDGGSSATADFPLVFVAGKAAVMVATFRFVRQRESKRAAGTVAALILAVVTFFTMFDLAVVGLLALDGYRKVRAEAKGRQDQVTQPLAADEEDDEAE